MWPVLAIGILTAIFAWIWYRGSGERREPDTPVQKEDSAVTAETEQPNSSPEDASLASGEKTESLPCGESTLLTADPDPCDTEPLPCGESPLLTADRDPCDTESLPCGESPLLTADRDPCDTESCQHGGPCPNSQEQSLNPDIFQAQDESKESESDLEGQSHIMTKAAPPVSVEVRAAEQLSGVARILQLQGDQDIKENPTDPKEDLQEQLPAVPKREDPFQEPPPEAADQLSGVARILQLQGGEDIKENPKEDLQEQLSAVPQREDPFQEPPPEAADQQANILLPNAESCPGKDPPSSGVLHAGAILGDEDQEVALQANGEVVLPTVMAAGAQEALSDSWNGSLSAQGGAQGEDPIHQGEVHGNEHANGAEEEAENGTGGQLENSFFVKESARNVLESEETLMQDSYVEINMSSDIECSIVTDQFTKDENVEKCDLETVSKCNDIVKPSSTLQENDIFDSSLTKSAAEALCDFQKLGTCPEGSSMEIYSILNQEKGMSGLGSSNTEKNSLYSPSEANINEADNQKAKKVATIQPMPQNVNFGFKVHYITHSDSQFIAVTGDHEKLGKWETYVPLTSGIGGFWSHAITLPADTNVAWKFIMVENGKIKRWEECNNRLLKITHEDIDGQLFWGYP